MCESLVRMIAHPSPRNHLNITFANAGGSLGKLVSSPKGSHLATAQSIRIHEELPPQIKHRLDVSTAKLQPWHLHWTWGYVGEGSP